MCVVIHALRSTYLNTPYISYDTKTKRNRYIIRINFRIAEFKQEDDNTAVSHAVPTQQYRAAAVSSTAHGPVLIH